MKKRILLTTALALTVFATATNIVYADGESEETSLTATNYAVEDFAKTLTFSSLSDFAINGNDLYFVDDGVLKVLSPDYSDGFDGDRKLTTPDIGLENLTNIEWSDGNFYVATEDATYVYDFTQNTLSEIEFDFTAQQMQQAGSYYYFFDSDVLCAYNGSITKLGDGFGHLKCYGDNAYAVKDNVLYKISGTIADQLDTGYKDFSSANTIAVGDIKDNLKGDFDGKMLTLSAGTYCTQIDIESLDGQYLQAERTIKLSDEITCLELCTSGNASVVIFTLNESEACYITTTPDSSAYADCTPTTTDVTKAYANQQVTIYSRPYISTSTAIGVIDGDASVEVQELFTSSYTTTDFYKVSYTKDGQSVSGYVAQKLLSPYSFSAEKNSPTTIADEPSYTNDLQRVVLIMIIIGLVMLSIAYLAVVGTHTKKKPKKSKHKEEIIIPPDPTNEV